MCTTVTVELCKWLEFAPQFGKEVLGLTDSDEINMFNAIGCVFETYPQFFLFDHVRLAYHYIEESGTISISYVKSERSPLAYSCLPVSSISYDKATGGIDWASLRFASDVK